MAKRYKISLTTSDEYPAAIRHRALELAQLLSSTLPIGLESIAEEDDDELDFPLVGTTGIASLQNGKGDYFDDADGSRGAPELARQARTVDTRNKVKGMSGAAVFRVRSLWKKHTTRVKKWCVR